MHILGVITLVTKYYIHPQIIKRQKLENITSLIKYGTLQLISNQVLNKAALVCKGNVIRSPLIFFNEENQEFQTSDTDWVINLGNKVLFIHDNLRRELNKNVIGWLGHGKLVFLENGKLSIYDVFNDEHHEITKINSKKLNKHYNLLFSNEGIVILTYDKGGLLILSNESVHKCKDVYVTEYYDTAYALCVKGRKSLLVIGSRFESPKVYIIDWNNVKNVQISTNVVSIQFKDSTHIYTSKGLITILKMNAEALSVSARNHVLLWIPNINWLAVYDGKSTNILTYLDQKPRSLGWLNDSIPVVLSKKSIKVFDLGMWWNFELFTRPRFITIGLHDIAIGFHDKLLVLNNELSTKYELDPQIDCTILRDELICLNPNREVIVAKLSNAIQLGYEVLRGIIDYENSALIEITAPKYSIINIENTSVTNLRIEANDKVVIDVKPKIITPPILDTVMSIDTGLKHIEYPLTFRIIQPRILSIKEIKAKSSFHGKLRESKDGCKGYIEFITCIGIPHVDLNLKLIAQIKTQDNNRDPIASLAKELLPGINDYKIRMEIPRHLKEGILRLTITDEYSMKLSSVEIPISFTLHDIPEEILRSWSIKELPNGKGVLKLSKDLLNLRERGYDVHVEIICSNKMLKAESDKIMINECKTPALLVIQVNDQEFEWIRRFSLLPRIKDVGSVIISPKIHGEYCEDDVEVSYKNISKFGIVTKLPQIIVKRNPPILINKALLILKKHQIFLKLIAEVCRSSIVMLLNNDNIDIKRLSPGKAELEFLLDPLSPRTEIIVTDGSATWKYVLQFSIKQAFELIQRLILKIKDIMEEKTFAWYN